MADTPLVRALTTLSSLPEVTSGAARVAQAVRSVRFSTGLRRGWESARTEASIRWVLADCQRAQIQITAQELRQNVAWSGEPQNAWAAGAWRCHVDVVAEMPPLNTQNVAPRAHMPVRTMLSRLHRDAGSTHPDSDVRQEAGILTASDVAKQDMLVEIAEAQAPGLVTTGVLLGQWMTEPLSIPTDPILQGSFIRWLSTVRGFEPTGTAVLDLDSLRDYRDTYESGTAKGMGEWFEHVATMYVEAMTQSLRISQSILAGRTDPEIP